MRVPTAVWAGHLVAQRRLEEIVAERVVVALVSASGSTERRRFLRGRPCWHVAAPRSRARPRGASSLPGGVGGAPAVFRLAMRLTRCMCAERSSCGARPAPYRPSPLPRLWSHRGTKGTRPARRNGAWARQGVDARMTTRITFRSWATWSGTFAISWHTAQRADAAGSRHQRARRVLLPTARREPVGN